MAKRIYLDHAATTPVLARAREAMADGLARWANPSSPHAEGRAARAALEEARGRVAGALGWRGAVIFTGGASEAIAIALGRAKGGRRLISEVEHDAVHRSALGAVRLPVGTNGMLDQAALAAEMATAGPRPVVAIQSVNSETGVVQPLDEIGAAVREAGGLLVVDCAQSAAKRALPDADFVIASAHKLGGPPGVGALLVRDLAALAPTGGQEMGYRGGTENLPAALGFAAALETESAWLDDAASLRARLEQAIVAGGGEIVAASAPRLPTIASYRMPGVSAAAQLIRFDLAGFAVSAGSACSSGALRTSPVLAAMGWHDAAAGEVVRVSFGRDTTRADVDAFASAWGAIAIDARARARARAA